MFDLNRQEVLRPVLQPHAINVFSTFVRDEPRKYRLSVVTNAFTGGTEVAERDVAPNTREIATRNLLLSWPHGVYSLSHVAMPFRPDGPLYGLAPDLGEDYGIRLGLISCAANAECSAFRKTISCASAAIRSFRMSRSERAGGCRRPSTGNTNRRRKSLRVTAAIAFAIVRAEAFRAR